MIKDAIERCAAAIRSRPNTEWVIGYSGGKDSTATLKIFLNGAASAGLHRERIVVAYCDTGVENPELDGFAKATLDKLANELPSKFPRASIQILKAPIAERFFVRVIGRGYAPPSNRFRWCTKGLRILPVQRFLKGRPDTAVVVLGLRFGESLQRDRSLRENEGAEQLWQKQQEGASNDLLLPIVDFSLEQVWAVAQGLEYPAAVDSIALEELYRGASDECPMVRSPLAPPCASGRFGCWTCTVVRRDKSAESMIQKGKLHLQPYLDFRNWLQQFRTESEFRWPQRRNGEKGPGPFTIAGRRKILHRLQLAEAEVGRELVSQEELVKIFSLWDEDIEVERHLGICNRPN